MISSADTISNFIWSVEIVNGSVDRLYCNNFLEEFVSFLFIFFYLFNNLQNSRTNTTFNISIKKINSGLLMPYDVLLARMFIVYDFIT